MSDLFERVRDSYGYATAYNANDEVPAHIQGLRAQNLKEFDRMIKQVKEDVWDEVATWFESERNSPGSADEVEAANPYRKQEKTR